MNIISFQNLTFYLPIFSLNIQRKFGMIFHKIMPPSHFLQVKENSPAFHHNSDEFNDQVLLGDKDFLNLFIVFLSQTF